MVDGDVAHLGILHARNVAYFAVGNGRLYGAVEQTVAYGQHRLIVIHLIYIGDKTLGTLKHGLHAFGIVGHLAAAGYGDGSAGKTPPIALVKQGAWAERQMQSAIDEPLKYLATFSSVSPWRAKYKCVIRLALNAANLQITP